MRSQQRSAILAIGMSMAPPGPRMTTAAIDQPMAAQTTCSTAPSFPAAMPAIAITIATTTTIGTGGATALTMTNSGMTGAMRTSWLGGAAATMMTSMSGGTKDSVTLGVHIGMIAAMMKTGASCGTAAATTGTVMSSA